MVTQGRHNLFEHALIFIGVCEEYSNTKIMRKRTIEIMYKTYKTRKDNLRMRDNKLQ